MLSLGCKCEGYVPKAKPTQTFICPANRQVYTLNKRNKQICEKLMNKKEIKNVSYNRQNNSNTAVSRY